MTAVCVPLCRSVISTASSCRTLMRNLRMGKMLLLAGKRIVVVTRVVDVGTIAVIGQGCIGYCRTRKPVGIRTDIDRIFWRLGPRCCCHGNLTFLGHPGLLPYDFLFMFTLSRQIFFFGTRPKSPFDYFEGVGKPACSQDISLSNDIGFCNFYFYLFWTFEIPYLFRPPVLATKLSNGAGYIWTASPVFHYSLSYDPVTYSACSGVLCSTELE